MTRMPVLVIACLLLAFAEESGATLIDRGGGLIYDDALDITWLQDAGLGGLRTWDDAVSWADTLVFGGFDDWRLPATPQPDPTCLFQFDPGGGFPLQGHGTDCIGSELGHLHNFNAVSASNQAPFENVQPDFYWSTEFDPDVGFAWMMLFPLEGLGGIPGIQLIDDKTNTHFGWAVRDGDVIDARVPVPSTLILIGSGLAGLAARRKRRARLSPIGHRGRFGRQMVPTMRLYSVFLLFSLRRRKTLSARSHSRASMRLQALNLRIGGRDASP